jgi:hypothetical protein
MRDPDLYNRLFFEEVYDLLVKEVGAIDRPDQKTGFVGSFTESRYDHHEWRFGGRLGFGGKFWRSPYRLGCPFYVNCYQEDSTPEREGVVARANEAISALFFKHRLKERSLEPERFERLQAQYPLATRDEILEAWVLSLKRDGTPNEAEKYLMHPLRDPDCQSCDGTGYIIFNNTCDCVDEKSKKRSGER